MGTCFGKRTPKRNSVCPSAENGNPCKRNLRKEPEDMIRDLEEANAEDSKLANGGVSFTVDFTDGDPTRMPSRLADRLNGAMTPAAADHNEVIYTREEREIMAELLRNDILRERKEKAAGAKS
ncbi:uncharacterized protein LOC132749074 [Ruditapes philippinarum]|uniref:uncharacterized protein LOC132749074 n=1 Tax=Ruditapes philippinarum TaxID=129788 RepID=UPI00295BA2D8|nr:uncharacterized protein LOC132749074 [Ruditapes philippinarum]